MTTIRNYDSGLGWATIDTDSNSEPPEESQLVQTVYQALVDAPRAAWRTTRERQAYRDGISDVIASITVALCPHPTTPLANQPHQRNTPVGVL